MVHTVGVQCPYPNMQVCEFKPSFFLEKMPLNNIEALGFSTFLGYPNIFL